SGALPAGVTLNGSNGAISGTPTTAATANFTVSVADGGTPRQTVQRALTLTVLAQLTITTTSPLVPGTVGTAYSQTLSAAGGTPNYTWSVVSGNLPNGITLSTVGALTGTPSAAGSFTFTARATDSSTPTLTAQKTIDL